MHKDSSVYVHNMIDKAREAQAFCAGHTISDFLQDDLVQSAVILKLIVIGEEARKIPAAVTAKIDLPWRQITGFRNMAVHEYFDLDLEQVWQTIDRDLPLLIEKCEEYLASL